MGSFYGHCKFYNGPMAQKPCERGVDIRKHVGGPEYGWMRRLPCIKVPADSKLQQHDVVPCELREWPTADEVAAEQKRISDLLDAFDKGLCGECGSQLEVTDTLDCEFSRCPNGHISSRGCKRVGEHLE